MIPIRHTFFASPQQSYSLDTDLNLTLLHIERWEILFKEFVCWQRDDHTEHQQTRYINHICLFFFQSQLCCRQTLGNEVFNVHYLLQKTRRYAVNPSFINKNKKERQTFHTTGDICRTMPINPPTAITVCITFDSHLLRWSVFFRCDHKLSANNNLWQSNYAVDICRVTKKIKSR